MLSRLGRRFLHISNLTRSIDQKSQLAELRKRTGYSFTNCKQALVESDYDLAKAEAWLQKEAQAQGWKKAERLQTRQTRQGLIGVMLEQDAATMVEVNCETDFVARNKEFQTLTSHVTCACFLQIASTETQTEQNSQIFKTTIDSAQMAQLPWRSEDGGRTLADLVALKIGQLGENMRLSRALGVRVWNGAQLASYTHPGETLPGDDNGPKFGRFGAILAYRRSTPVRKAVTEQVESFTDENREDLPAFLKRDLTAEQCAHMVCQHIVGLNPKTISSDETPENKENEQALLNQEFLLEAEISVRTFVEHFGVHVLHFERYELGETLQPENAV